MPPAAWTPRYQITPAIAAALVRIGEAQGAIEHRSWSPLVEEAIRERARVRSTHFSTQIEGNRLTLEEVAQVVESPARVVRFAGRERDVREVDHYWHALRQVEDWARQRTQLTERLLQRLHAIVFWGPGRRPTPYRSIQNAIREAGSRRIVYLPPEPTDVPPLMAGLVAWMTQAEGEGLPAPILAGLAHYQFETIHPFLDGNGRTGRLLATLLLHRGGLGLRGFYSLEEHHARDLPAYYRGLQAHDHHNYYFGRADAGLTPWLEYFVGGVAHVFALAQDEALRLADRGMPPEPEAVRRLDPRARRVLALFGTHPTIVASDVARLLPIGDRMVRHLMALWVAEEFLLVADPSKRNRRYTLAEPYRSYVAALTAPELSGKSPDVPRPAGRPSRPRR